MGKPCTWARAASSVWTLSFSSKVSVICVTSPRGRVTPRIAYPAPLNHSRYLIAVGGAGSSGLPAFASGTLTMVTTRTKSATSAAQNGAPHFTRVTSWPDPTSPAITNPHRASPAISPEAVSTPALSTRAFWALLRPRRSRSLSVTQRITPPTKMAEVVPSGRYMPTANSITLLTSIMIMAKPIRIPTITNGQAMSPPTMPLASMAISPAWGAGNEGLPKWYALSRTASGTKRTNEATTMPNRSPISILAGVPPRIYPTLRSCNISPATAEETQTTAATPRTAATPPLPETPKATISRAATTRVQSVSPETGLLEEPIIPTRLPETAAKKKPSTIITTAATTAPVMTFELERLPAPAIKK